MCKATLIHIKVALVQYSCKKVAGVRQPFYMRICNGVDEKYQHHFVINVGYCIAEFIAVQKSS